MLRVLDAAAIRRWADAAVRVLEARREELDRLNVFPVPDADTGSNLALTMRAAADALGRLPATAGSAEAAAALASGALRGARGNSGVIVSQLPRGLSEALHAGEYLGEHGRTLAAALSRADELARAAVSHPVEGTILSVLSAAARAATREAETARAREDGPRELVRVLDAAVTAAGTALAETPRQLPTLARAGVVDAGGKGLVLILEALLAVLSGRPVDVVTGTGTYRPSFRSRERDALIADRESGSAEFDYEVMYLLEGSSPDRVELMRERLAELGDSVVVVGDGQVGGTAMWNVHVHCTDVGAAIEVGLEAGQPRRITVVRFADQLAERGADDGRFVRDRAVVALVTGRELADLVRTDGVTALVAPPDRQPDVAEIVAAVAGCQARHVVVLPNDMDLNQVAEEAADQFRATGRTDTDVVVVPTSSVLQGLAALAVHDPERRSGADVVAMAEAAAATRTGVIRIAESEALTWAGRCFAGDVLGLVDGEVVLIEQDLRKGAAQLVDRMLTTGGELVTVLLGQPDEGGTAELGEYLAGHLRQTHPEVEVTCYPGGPAGRPVQLGVE
ncbi:DAK2 domain-containing protein [Pseudonocardia eucalypti]|uniref:DAK2 domain-containing protein n=1 Tax=Pseudonocardia eucalypti TaxID=648755 RepID=A0ABP9QAY4_9PSEU|nr:DAK2 domain fusion protein YloV [Pseudonocardia eucalypti]